MQQISKNRASVMLSGNEYADIKREERRKHKALRDKKKSRKWQWSD